MRVLVLSLVLLVRFEPASLTMPHQAPDEVEAAAKPVENSDASSSRKPCFEQQDRQTSELEEVHAVAGLPESLRYWLAEDVVYIISPEERCVLLHLASDQERQQFVDQFWLRRASNPESLDNDFKQEHYRRIVFANEKLGTNLPGWRTDRGRVYITLGPPDKIESHPEGSQNEGRDAGKQHEIWDYRYIEGVGPNIDLEFVDPSRSGGYRLTTPIQTAQEPPWYLPGVSTQYRDPVAGTLQHIVLYIGPMRPPKTKFKDLEAMVVARILRDQVHFSHSIAFTRATHASTMVHIAVEIPADQLLPSTWDGEHVGGAEIFGRISKPSGWVVETFERTRSVNEPVQPTPNPEIVALQPGPYRLAIAVKDLASGMVGVVYTTFDVPRYDDLSETAAWPRHKVNLGAPRVEVTRGSSLFCRGRGF